MAEPVTLPADELFSELESALRTAGNDRKSLYQAVAQEPFTHDRAMALLFLGFISFFLLDDKAQTIYAAGVTDNEYYRQSVEGYDFSIEDYKLPLSATDNSLAKAIASGKPVSSDNWDSFRRPQIAEGPARLNQATSGIGYSVVYPLSGKVKGALMFNFYQFPEAVGESQEAFMQRYTDLVSSILA